MRLQTLALTSLLLLSLTFTSCMFPGTLFRFNRTTETQVKDSLKIIDRDFEYFCFDWQDCKCIQRKEVTIDTARNRVHKIEIVRATSFVKDGTKRMVFRTFIYDANGKLLKSTKKVNRTYGRGGIERYFREVEHLENGQVKITNRRGRKHNPDYLERVRYRGKKYRNKKRTHNNH